MLKENDTVHLGGEKGPDHGLIEILNIFSILVLHHYKIFKPVSNRAQTRNIFLTEN